MSSSINLTEYGLDDLYTVKRSITEARYAIAAMFCLQIYEWTAGMEMEFKMIHKASWTTMKALYLCCRYYPLSVWILITWAYVGDHNVDTCNHFTRLVHALIAPCQFFAQAVMLIRAVAFAGQDLRVVVLLGLCYLGLVGIDIWVFCVQVDIPPAILFTVLGGTGCFPNYGNEGMGLRIGVSMLAATLMDLLSLLVVVLYCLRSRLNRDVSLARYFMNQGMVG
ncbi:hypothetical protein CPB84DRAFT_1776053 [Gymnopilus junonius]|uniref:DUF6533 domain-containing protein n=1 Tax=Gymnopilus junonius TaxID=109634 RepID=A0A9P5TN33_GYMJU|nr:hypothetical protein CPB84DRAFT_1776053 [Gymnopilus junonius]